MKKLSKKQRNNIYAKALELNLDWCGYDNAVEYMKTKVPNYLNRTTRIKTLPEIGLFDIVTNYSRISKEEAIEIRSIALMFCVEMTKN